MTRVLVSVQNLREAQVALKAGADIIDLKSPERGSLGALPTRELRGIVASLERRRPISATVGDLPMEPRAVTAAAAATFDTGVDYVKIGFFPDGDPWATVRALAPLAERGCRLVAVLFGDLNPDLGWPARLAEAGFVGCMLDTMDKTHGSLTQVRAVDFLRRFVAEVQRSDLLCGLAGSLTLGDIPALLELHPDYLGFRGALCRGHKRTHSLDGNLVRRIGSAVRGAAVNTRTCLDEPQIEAGKERCQPELQ